MNSLPPRKRFYPLYWLLLAVSRLPFPVLYLLSDFLATFAYRFLRYRKKVVVQNLQNAFPEKTAPEIEALARAFYKNLCDVLVETIKLAAVSPEALHRKVQYKHSEAMEAFINNGSPLIVMGSHQANWEWALPGAAVHLPFPVVGVYKPLANDFFEWYLLKLRSRLGPKLITMKETLRDLIRHQKTPRGISILSDQTPPRGEIQYWTTFLNQDTAFYVGADKLAASFKYPVFFMGAHREERGSYVYTLELLHDGQEPLPEGFPITEAYARRLEAWIRKYPADYLWSHRRWKHQRPRVAAESIPAVS